MNERYMLYYVAIGDFPEFPFNGTCLTGKRNHLKNYLVKNEFITGETEDQIEQSFIKFLDDIINEDELVNDIYVYNSEDVSIFALTQRCQKPINLAFAIFKKYHQISDDYIEVIHLKEE